MSEITVKEWLDNAINAINKFGANQSEYTATLKKDDGEYIIKVLVHKVEEDEDE